MTHIVNQQNIHISEMMKSRGLPSAQSILLKNPNLKRNLTAPRRQKVDAFIQTPIGLPSSIQLTHNQSLLVISPYMDFLLHSLPLVTKIDGSRAANLQQSLFTLQASFSLILQSQSTGFLYSFFANIFFTIENLLHIKI